MISFWLFSTVTLTASSKSAPMVALPLVSSSLMMALESEAAFRGMSVTAISRTSPSSTKAVASTVPRFIAACSLLRVLISFSYTVLGSRASTICRLSARAMSIYWPPVKLM